VPDITRTELYEALDTVDDALNGGYRSRRPLPEFGHLAGAPNQTAAAGAPGTPDTPANDSLAAIAADAARCRACRLAASRHQVVPGEGAEHPLVLVVGEGPGAEEDKTGRAFVGPAGQLLDKMLGAIGLSRDTNTYIANVVKCRPPMNRDPAPDEQAACRPLFDRQLAILKPAAILAVGRVPAQSLLAVKDGIGKLRGTVWSFQGIPLVATYHPSALLRDESLKRPAWEDLKLLKTLLPDA